MPAWKTLPTPAEIVQHLDRFVRGQARAKRDLASCVYRHYLALAYGENHPGSLSPFGKRHVLLLGPTGAGKTFLVTTLAEHLGVPVAFGSAASLVENGYVGEHLESVFRRLLSATRGSTELAERGIVFLDEIDKVRRQEVNSRDIAGEGVQTSLLAPLDGCPVEVRFDSVSGCTLNTSRMLFICTGAFSGLPELIRRRISAGSTFGFRVCEEDPSALSDDELLARGELQDLEAYGFIPEFLGRFAVISTVTSLSRDDLVGILRDTEESPLVRQRRWFAQHGVELLLSDDAFDAIVDIAIRNRTNARGLERILAKMLATLDFQLPELAASGVSSIRMDRKALLGQGEPLIRRGGSATRDTAAAANVLRTQVTGPQFTTLQELDRLGITVVGELARALQMSQPTLTGILDRLEKRGLATRTRGGADRRTVQAAITEEGKRVLRGTPSALQEGVRRELAKLDEWERTLMRAMLQRLAAIVSAALPKAADATRRSAETTPPAPQ